MQKKDQNGFTEEQIDFYMNQALQQAKKAYEVSQVPVGCIFLTKSKNNPKWRIIAKSHNLTNIKKNATRHCQINCIQKMNDIITEQEHQNLILFVTVQPCIMCTYALNIFKVKFVYFGQFNDKFGGCGSVMKRNQFSIQGGIKPQQSIQLIKEFYQRGNQRINQNMRNKRRKKDNQNKQI